MNEASPLVRDLRRRKQKAKRKWQKLDEILEYVRKTDEEYRNSKPSATGYEQVVWRSCTMRECNAAGKCQQAETGTKFVKDGWRLAREKGETSPLERVQLLLALQCQPTGE